MRLGKIYVVCIMLLALMLFVQAAGAVYIPGEETPDDGMMHIMAADDAVAGDTASDSTYIPLSMSDNMLIAEPVADMAYDPELVYATGGYCADGYIPVSMTSYPYDSVDRFCDCSFRVPKCCDIYGMDGMDNVIWDSGCWYGRDSCGCIDSRCNVRCDGRDLLDGAVDGELDSGASILPLAEMLGMLI